MSILHQIIFHSDRQVFLMLLNMNDEQLPGQAGIGKLSYKTFEMHLEFIFVSFSAYTFCRCDF